MGMRGVYVYAGLHARGFLESETTCSHNLVGIIICQLDRGEAHIALIQHPILAFAAASAAFAR